jgi:hypothetical protein
LVTAIETPFKLTEIPTMQSRQAMVALPVPNQVSCPRKVWIILCVERGSLIACRFLSNNIRSAE